jgi:hypothetical protein
MNGAQRDAFIQLTQAADKMAQFLNEVIVTEKACDLSDRWYKARNRYFELEAEAAKSKLTARDMARKSSRNSPAASQKGGAQ